MLRIVHPFQKPYCKISEDRRLLSTQLAGIALLKACQQAGFDNRRSGLLVADESIAGYPALKMRDFLCEHKLTGITKETIQTSMDLNPTDAGDFLSKRVDQGLIKESHRQNGYTLFDLTDYGMRSANASAAKPIHRRTAERILSEFMERVNKVNATPEYLYRVDGVILFGSFVSDVEQLGDVNVAVYLGVKFQ